MSASEPSKQPSKHSVRREQEARSLDLVQRVIVSGLVVFVFASVMMLSILFLSGV